MTLTTHSPAKISNARLNKLGGAAFDGCFAGMGKPMDFVVHPLKPRDPALQVHVQSDTQIGWITAGGNVHLSPPIAHGLCRAHLDMAVLVDKLNAEDLFLLKTSVHCSFEISRARGQATLRATSWGQK